MYSWTGDKALRELEEANISKQCFPILLECATKVSHLFDIMDYALLNACVSFINLIIFQGNQSCYRLGDWSATFKWHVGDNTGRSGIKVLRSYILCYYIQLFTYLWVLITNDLYQSHFRLILITNLFLLKKWITHVRLPAFPSAMC